MGDMNKFLLILLLGIFHGGSTQLIRDSRCFLENGVTSAHLFVSEDLRVGDTVGWLGVIGDPGPKGDIELRLQERDSPVTFSPHSRNLTLTRPLDKEGVEGPASVYVNVICERKRTLDPGFVIPVNIRVTDANDNAPQFINAPYILNISEVTVVGTRVLQGVKAVDIDQPGPFSTVQYSIISGPHSDFFVFLNALEGTLVLRKHLDYEKLSNFSVGIRAQDQGNPPQSSTTLLYVNVIDADDQNPAFLSDQYQISVPLNIKTRKILRVDPEPIKAVDQDVGISAPVRYSIQGGILPFLSLNTETADVVMTRPLQDHELISSATLVIKATQIDNPDRYALATVIIAREGSLDLGTPNGGHLPVRFTKKEYQTSVQENTPSGSLILTTTVNKADPNLRFWLTGASEDLDMFSITNSGDLLLKGHLDYEKRTQHNFLVHVTDKQSNNTARVNVTIEDVNEWEPRFRHPKYDFHLRTMKEAAIVGKLEAADGDRGDRVSLSLRGPDARAFEIRDNGELILRSLGPFNGTIARLVAIASDTGRPPRSSMIPVIVHLPTTASLPIAAKTAPAWVGSSMLVVAVFGAVLGLLGVVILVLILYIYKQPKSGSSVSSGGDGYREKSPVPSALSPTPQILGASMLQDSMDMPRDRRCGSNDIDNPVFGEDNACFNNAMIKTLVNNRQLPLYSRHKVAPAPEPPALSATSNIPNVGGLVQNMNDLSARNNMNNHETGSQNSSNFSGDPPDSLAPTWPAESMSRRVKKLSWDDDDRTLDSVEVAAESRPGSSQPNNERLNLTVYF